MAPAERVANCCTALLQSAAMSAGRGPVGGRAGMQRRGAAASIRCCLGDNCQSSGLYGPVGSGQVRLGGVSGQCGLVGCSRVWWNDRQNDHLSKRWGRVRLRRRTGRLHAGKARRGGQRPAGPSGGVSCSFVPGPAGQAANPTSRCPREHLRASKDRLTAMPTSVSAGGSRPSGRSTGPRRSLVTSYMSGSLSTTRRPLTGAEAVCATARRVD
jgi:hypothetical protein